MVDKSIVNTSMDPEVALQELCGRYGFEEDEAIAIGLMVLATATRGNRMVASVEVRGGIPVPGADVMVFEVAGCEFTKKGLR